MSKKTWKLGEVAIGGIIQVEITGKIIQIKALDYFSKEVVMHGTITSIDKDARQKVNSFLNDLTHYCYAEKVLTWIETKVKFKNEFDF